MGYYPFTIAIIYVVIKSIVVIGIVGYYPFTNAIIIVVIIRAFLSL